MYKAVMFDMDGLLLDTERLQLDCFVAAQRDFDLPTDPSVFMACIGLRQDVGLAIMQDRLPKGINFDQFYKHWLVLVNLATAKDIALRPCVRDVLEGIKTRGIPMGVATSSRTIEARHHLDVTGILSYFEHVMGGDTVVAPKPDPQIYLNLADALDVDPRDTAAFEDSESGTRAAMGAGAKTVQVPDLIPPTDEFRGFGQTVSDNLWDGAVAIGLIERG